MLVAYGPWLVLFIFLGMAAAWVALAAHFADRWDPQARLHARPPLEPTVQARPDESPLAPHIAKALADASPWARPILPKMTHQRPYRCRQHVE